MEQVEELNRQLSQKTESLEAARDDLASFNRSLAHDLRSPLKTLLCFSKVMEEEYSAQMNAECIDYLHRISGAATRIEKIVEGLATLSGTAQAKMQIEEVDLSEIAENILRAAQASAPGRKMDFHVEPGLKTLADGDLIHVALENLLGNSFKFTSKKAEAKIEFGAITQDDERVYFVRDNGAGFDPGHTSKLWVPFERLHLQQEFAGTGIGLVTVKRIIQRYQGRIWAEGEPGKGATFYFALGPSSKGEE